MVGNGVDDVLNHPHKRIGWYELYAGLTLLDTPFAGDGSETDAKR
jgi:hypothetical protein